MLRSVISTMLLLMLLLLRILLLLLMVMLRARSIFIIRIRIRRWPSSAIYNIIILVRSLVWSRWETCKFLIRILWNWSGVIMSTVRLVRWLLLHHWRGTITWGYISGTLVTPWASCVRIRRAVFRLDRWWSWRARLWCLSLWWHIWVVSGLGFWGRTGPAGDSIARRRLALSKIFCNCILEFFCWLVTYYL